MLIILFGAALLARESPRLARALDAAEVWVRRAWHRLQGRWRRTAASRG
jgi:hypothetical protein